MKKLAAQVVNNKKTIEEKKTTQTELKAKIEKF